MTRQRLYTEIRQRLIDYQLPCDDEAREVADAAVDCALEYLQRYVMGMSEQLVKDEAYSEAMVAGTVITKIKRLRGES